MIHQIEEKIEALFPKLLEDLKRIVAIRSVEGEKSDDYPFGPGPYQALEEIEKIGKELGFETRNIDNQLMVLEYGPQTEEYLGIFGHLDVVPEGRGWKYEPYHAIIDNNKIYGRGVLDNKGPILSNLYALYALKELGFEPNKRIKIVFGSNEETGFEDIHTYVRKEPAPVFGWTPDNKFPVVYGERGRLKLEISFEEEAEWLYFINRYLLNAPQDGSQFDLDVEDEDFGKMKVQGVQIDRQEAYTVSLSFAYPTGISDQDILKQIKARLSEKTQIKVQAHWEPVLKTPDPKYVEILTDVYKSWTDYDATPTTTTGGTYSKFVPNIVAFGPSFPGQNNIAHLPDEWMDLDDLMLMTKIYAHAIYATTR